MSANTSVQQAQHPAIDYLKGLFEEGDFIFFLLIHSTAKHLDKRGYLVADTKLLPLMPLSQAASQEVMDLLTRFEAGGWNVYVCMNPFPRGTQHRREALVKVIRNLFIESDEGDSLALINDSVKKGLIPLPHSALQSSPGKHHVVWHVEGIEPVDAKPLLEALAKRFGGDPQATDLHRVLRMPGFRNLKPKYAKPICELNDLYQDMGGRYTRDKFKLETKIASKTPMGDAISSEKLATVAKFVTDNAAEAKFEMAGPYNYGNGVKWLFECPWAELHTTGSNDEGAIFLLEDGRLEFKCFHAHCAERGWSDIRKRWGDIVGHQQTFGENPDAFLFKENTLRANYTPEVAITTKLGECDPSSEESDYLQKTLAVFASVSDYERLKDTGMVMFPSSAETVSGWQQKYDRVVLIGPSKHSEWGRIRDAHSGAIHFKPKKEMTVEYLRFILNLQAVRKTIKNPPRYELVTPVTPVGDTASYEYFLPESALASSMLGDIYNDILKPNEFPLEMALPALVTCASVLVPPQVSLSGTGLIIGDNIMNNLYTALIGSVNSGKSQAIEWAAKALGIYHSMGSGWYIENKFGSTEMMLAYLKKKIATSEMGANFLVNPDEWSFMFQKANNANSSFASFMTTSFYRRRQNITVGNRVGEVMLNNAVSWAAGIVDTEFDAVFSNSTIGGTYDRFLFGHKEGWKWDYRDYPRPFELRQRDQWSGSQVVREGSVSEVIKQWNKVYRDQGIGRVVEICVRIATIYASMDGRTSIGGKDLEKLLPLALNQMRIRSQFNPNAGLTPDAIYSNAVINWLKSHTRGEWVGVGTLNRGVHSTRLRLGPNVAERCLAAMARQDEIDVWLPKDRNGKDVAVPVEWTAAVPRTGLIRRRRETETNSTNHVVL